MSLATELEKLKALHADGTLSDAEYEAAKARLISGAASTAKADGQSGTGWALWTLVVVVVIAAGAALFMLDEINRSVQMIVGGVGLVAAAAGSVLSLTEDLSMTALCGFGLAGLAIGAVAFAALSPILIPAALVVLVIGMVWAWFGDLFTG